MRIEAQDIVPGTVPEAKAKIPLAVWCLVAYLAAITIFGKGPTYLGYPPLYWGEVTMAGLLVWMYIRMFPATIPPRIMTSYSALIVVFMIMGAVHTALGYRHGYTAALRDAAIWYYASFFFIGLYITTMPKASNWLWKWITWAWLAALLWYASVRLSGGLVIRLSPVLPWRGVRLLSGSGSENLMHMCLGAVLLVMGVVPKRSNQVVRILSFVLVCLAAGLLFASYPRGAKTAVTLAVIVGFLATLKARKQIWPTGKVFWLSLMLVWALAMGAILAGPGGIAKVSQLERFEDVVIRAESGTTHWRRVWWTNLVNEVHRENPAYGLGFGINLARYNPYLSDLFNPYAGGGAHPWPVRSPHNFNMTIFARMGYFGLTLWLAILFIGLGRLFVRVRGGGIGEMRYTLDRRKELTFWLIMLVATWVNSSFGVLMEGPVLGIWFWFALGFATGRSQGPDGLESSRRQGAGPLLADPAIPSQGRRDAVDAVPGQSA
jgi:O-antigen ligase/polysaccharide polymerase Wzy-like membrane protein